MDDVAAAAAASSTTSTTSTTTYNVMYFISGTPVNAAIGAERVVVFKHTPTCMSVTVGNHLSYRRVPILRRPPWGVILTAPRH